MGIDGINKPGGSSKPGVAGPEPNDQDFRDKLDVDRTSRAEHVGAPSPLQQLHAGTLTLDQYLDAQVNAAVAHLQGKLPAEQLDFVKESLRAQLSTDPVLVELVRRTTGSTLSPE